MSPRPSPPCERFVPPANAKKHGRGGSARIDSSQGIGPDEGSAMAKGQKKSNKEARKPKAEKTKTIAAAPSTKEGVVRGLENMKR